MTDRERAASQRNRGLAVLFNLGKRCPKVMYHMRRICRRANRDDGLDIR